VHYAYHFELDIGSAYKVAVDFAFKVAQRVGEMGDRVPTAQGLAVAGLFVAVADDFAREVFQRPLCKDTLSWARVAQLLRDLEPEQRQNGLLPELTGVKSYAPAEFDAKVDWMMKRGFLEQAPAYEDIVRSK